MIQNFLKLEIYTVQHLTNLQSITRHKNIYHWKGQRKNSVPYVIVLKARVYCTSNIEKKGFFYFNQYCRSGSHSALNWSAGSGSAHMINVLNFTPNFKKVTLSSKCFFLHILLFVLKGRTVKELAVWRGYKLYNNQRRFYRFFAVMRHSTPRTPDLGIF